MKNSIRIFLLLAAAISIQIVGCQQNPVAPADNVPAFSHRTSYKFPPIKDSVIVNDPAKVSHGETN